MRDALQNHLTGKAGEHAVAAQLMIRGVQVWFPACDYGVDLMTGSGCRIQVKSAHFSSSPRMVKQHGEAAYVFPLPHTKRLALTNDKSEIRQRPPMSSVCDIVVFWGIDQNRFWISPSYLCDDRQVYVLGRKNPPRFVGSIQDLEEMKRLGYSRAEIARKYNIDACSIGMIMNRPGFEKQNPSGVSLVRECENAWDYIVNFEKGQAQAAPGLTFIEKDSEIG